VSRSKMTRALHKIARMRSHELLFRLREKAGSELERSGLYRTQVAAPADFKGFLASCCAARFYRAHRRCSLDAAVKSLPSWMGRAASAGSKLWPMTAITVMHPACGSSRVEQVDAGSALACVVEHGDFRDIVILPTTGDRVTGANFQVHGDLFWIRTRSGQVVRQASWPGYGMASPDSKQLAKDGRRSPGGGMCGISGIVAFNLKIGEGRIAEGDTHHD